MSHKVQWYSVGAPLAVDAPHVDPLGGKLGRMLLTGSPFAARPGSGKKRLPGNKPLPSNGDDISPGGRCGDAVAAAAGD